jgi:CubicO group peptidase (beta-lactamase class C family)
MFNIGSVTKQFTAMCTLQLVQKGLLSIDDCIGEYLTDFINGANVKIRDMLNMVSGMPEYWCKPEWKEEAGLTSKDAYEFIKTLTDYTPPLEKFQYCNSNYIVLGKLIEHISGLRLGEYMEQNIFKPLGMDRTTLLSPDRTFPDIATGYKSPRVSRLEKATSIYSFDGAGGIYSCAADLSKWNNALYTETLLSKELLDEMFKPILSGYAMGWYIDGLKAHHGGDAPGFSTCLMRHGKQRLLMLLLCNFEGCKDSHMGHYTNLVESLIL